MHEYSFEKLEVWKELRVLIKMIYKLTESFPHSEIFGLGNQLRRAAVSSASNYAEGNSRFSYKDKARFFNVSYGSLIEILAQVVISSDLGFTNEEKLHEVRLQIEKCTRMISGLRQAVKERLESRE